MAFKLIIFILVLCVGGSFEAKNCGKDDTDVSSPIVALADGKLRGRVCSTVEKNKTYYAYQGIPFAKPPTGDLRFRPPEKNSKWNGILNATEDRSECVQGIVSVTGSEDCLYTNVYTPSLTGRSAVMVYIYGGAFVSGNSSYVQQSPDYLLDEGIVFVQFNYRLGAFGFLSTEDLVVPGNNGLKDQCLALKWVRKNIHNFGGDPENVTIFGQSAGAASVSYQLQSTCAKGTYQRAIMQSGSSLCLWALHRKSLEAAKEIAEKFKIDTSNTTTLIEGLKKVDYKKLQQIAMAIGSANALKNPLAGIQFGPVMEPYHSGAFFYNYSDEMLLQGHFNRVPTIMGVTSNEGAAAGDIPALIRLYLLKYDLQFTLLAPEDLTKDPLQRSSAAFAIKLHYFNVLPMALQTDAVIKFVSDDQFNKALRRAALSMGKYAPVHFYVFSHEGELGNAGERTLKGVGHTEDLSYLFRKDKAQVSDRDKLTRKRMIRLWVNFAKYGNPTPERDPLLQNVTWLPATQISDNLIYLDINEDLDLGLNPFNENMKFYDKIYRIHGSRPHDTY